jgi:hypothetical protein
LEDGCHLIADDDFNGLTVVGEASTSNNGEKATIGGAVIGGDRENSQWHKHISILDRDIILTSLNVRNND